MTGLRSAIHFIAGLALVAASGRVNAAASFGVPNADRPAVWEAEQAKADTGWMRKDHSWASGGAYLATSTGQAAALEFPFETSEPVTLRVWPVWWRNSEERPAARFPSSLPYFEKQYMYGGTFAKYHHMNVLDAPYMIDDITKYYDKPFPLKEKPGPDKIVRQGNTLFFTAPDSHQLGLFDLEQGRVKGAIALQGYPSDLVLDEARGRLYATEADHDSVVVIDTAAGKILSRGTVKGVPNSMALASNGLWVACLEDKAIRLLDRDTLAVQKEIPLPQHPFHVAVVEGASPSLAVWFTAAMFEPLTGKEYPADRLFWPDDLFPVLRGTNELSLQYLFRQPVTVQAVEPGRLKLACPRVVDARVDVADITGTNQPYALCLNTNKLFFTVPEAGSIGVIDLADPGHPRNLAVGGQPAGLAAFRRSSMAYFIDVTYLWHGETYDVSRSFPYRTVAVGPKVYVADREKNRVLVLDAAKAEVVKEIPVPAGPTKVFVFDACAYVTCEGARQVAVIDVEKDQLVKTVALSAEPSQAFVGLLGESYSEVTEGPTDWIIINELPVRLVVQFKPLSIDLKTFEARPLDEAPRTDFGRNLIRYVSGAGATQTVFVGNAHVVSVGSNRYDTGAVTDRSRPGRETVLGPRDQPGTISYSLDDEPTLRDWTQDGWITGQRWFLTKGTEEYELWNAARITVPPGRHVLRVHSTSPWARLDGLRVARVLDADVGLDIRPEPDAVHGAVPVPSYRAVFAASEPVAFTARLTNRTDRDLPLRVDWIVWDYTNALAARGAAKVTVNRQAEARVPIQAKLDRTGPFTLEVACRTARGVPTKQFYRFSRVPKIETPRLLYRKSDTAAIRERIKKYPVLFARYEQWLRRHYGQPDFFPKRLGGSTAQQYTRALQRWHVVGCAFAQQFLVPPGDTFFVQKIPPLMATDASLRNAYGHGWEFVSSDAVVYDMLCADFPEIATYRDTAEELKDNPDCFPLTTYAVDDPLTPLGRAVLDKNISQHADMLNYFAVHCGERGGNWWLGTRGGCQCMPQTQGYNLLYFRGFLGQQDLFESPCVRKLYVHDQYTLPHRDERGLFQNGLRTDGFKPEGGGDTTRWMMSSLTRNPLEATRNGLAARLQAINGPLAGNEAEAVDAFFGTHVNCILPLMVAFGWFDPTGPTLDWAELPPSSVFDVEGEVCMKSGWDTNMTEVLFVSGHKDVSYREAPNTLVIWKAGETLLDSDHSWDHGTPTPAWGNCVVVPEDQDNPPRRMSWCYGSKWPRIEERAVLNRFPRELRTCMARDELLSGIHSFHYQFTDGGIVLHSHTEQPFYKAGEVVGYETAPDYDYAAGDASGAWPLEQVEEMYRQVVFLRPNTLVVYDRGRLGPEAGKSLWLAKTVNTPSNNPTLTATGNTFRVQSARASLDGTVLLPEKVDLRVGFPVLRILPAEQKKDYEYLVILQTATPAEPAPTVTAEVVRENGQVGVRLVSGGKSARILFNQTGAVGGSIALDRRKSHELPQRIEPSYGQWRADPRFKMWITDPRFRDYMTEEDRRKYGRP